MSKPATIQINLTDDTFIIVNNDYKTSLTINYMIEDNEIENDHQYIITLDYKPKIVKQYFNVVNNGNIPDNFEIDNIKLLSKLAAFSEFLSDDSYTKIFLLKISSIIKTYMCQYYKLTDDWKSRIESNIVINKSNFLEMEQFILMILKIVGKYYSSEELIRIILTQDFEFLDICITILLINNNFKHYERPKNKLKKIEDYETILCCDVIANIYNLLILTGNHYVMRKCNWMQVFFEMIERGHDNDHFMDITDLFQTFTDSNALIKYYDTDYYYQKIFDHCNKFIKGLKYFSNYLAVSCADKHYCAVNEAVNDKITMLLEIYEYEYYKLYSIFISNQITSDYPDQVSPEYFILFCYYSRITKMISSEDYVRILSNKLIIDSFRNLLFVNLDLVIVFFELVNYHKDIPNEVFATIFVYLGSYYDLKKIRFNDCVNKDLHEIMLRTVYNKNVVKFSDDDYNFVKKIIIMLSNNSFLKTIFTHKVFIGGKIDCVVENGQFHNDIICNTCGYYLGRIRMHENGFMFINENKNILCDMLQSKSRRQLILLSPLKQFHEENLNSFEYRGKVYHLIIPMPINLPNESSHILVNYLNDIVSCINLCVIKFPSRDEVNYFALDEIISKLVHSFYSHVFVSDDL